MNFLFWNVAKRDASEAIAAVAQSVRADILILAENDEKVGSVLTTLNPVGTAEYRYIPAPVQSSAVQIYAKFPSEFITPMAEEGRMSLWEIAMPGQASVILGGLHLPSKLWKDESEQAEISGEISRVIRYHEQRMGHDRTVLVGDFNMNPFERGLLTAYGFNAVMTRKDAIKASRTVNGKSHPFFFNPMWSLFHDGDSGPPGTYHHASPSHLSIFWHMFDQVLLRPSLLDRFDKASLRIVTAYAGNSLVDAQGKPLVSDHLPISFTLQL